ncbi:hypothetical protein T492DRAFT_946957 [Pavlovales sp. CCMP2436]|nr:hypothetical protein T492DRAFT_946957 [Pavlovales sp. CCMP2436]
MSACRFRSTAQARKTAARCQVWLLLTTAGTASAFARPILSHAQSAAALGQANGAAALGRANGPRLCAPASDDDEYRLASYGGTSVAVKAIVGGLTALVNAVFPPASLTPEEADAEAERRMTRERAPPLQPSELVAGLRGDFERQYLFTGAIDPALYDDDCVYTDPTLSFQGLATFQRNLASLRPVLDALLGEYSVELFSLEKLGTSCIEARWRMSGDIRLPWRPSIELVGRTRYTYDPSRQGRIVRYDEYWQSSAAEQLLALFKPARSGK